VDAVAMAFVISIIEKEHYTRTPVMIRRHLIIEAEHL
jgi:hypothetical protein